MNDEKAIGEGNNSTYIPLKTWLRSVLNRHPSFLGDKTVTKIVQKQLSSLTPPSTKLLF